MEPSAEDAALLDQIDWLALPRRADGAIQFPDPVVFPPPGFLGVGAFGRVDGDAAGYYWPIGAEDAAPVWCEIWHDDWSMQPDRHRDQHRADYECAG